MVTATRVNGGSCKNCFPSSFALIEFPTGIIDLIVLLIHLRDVKIASLKQQIQELELRQEKTRSKRAWETLNGENPFLCVCDQGNHRRGIRKETLCRLGLPVEITECVGKVPSNYHGFLCSLGMRVSSHECVGMRKRSIVYDTDIEDVIEEEEGFVRKGGFGREEDNIKDIVVMANDLCSSMIQTTLSVDFLKTIDSNPHDLIWLQKCNLVKVSILIGKKYQEYLKAASMADKFGFKTIKVHGRVIIKKWNLMHGI
ncbi:hypothetical protein Tco_1157194 [Tanacetum coccineum]